MTSPDGDIAEDQLTSGVGSYNASAPLGSAGPWIMQMVAFRASSGSVPPPPSAAHTVALTWNASTSSNVASYKVYRATGTSTSYSQIAAGIVNLSYTDTNVTGGSTYTYAVCAVDNSGNESSYSNAAKVTIPSS
jgi:hypothetical protein